MTAAYRLLKHGGFSRVLFLVDRNNLADQTLAEFGNYRTPDDGRRFTEIYNVDKLTAAGMLASTHVAISTIQRVYRVLEGAPVPEGDDPSLDGATPAAPVTVQYNPELPPEAFDLVIVDEAHRSIYGLWRGVLEYFDAHVIGASPKRCWAVRAQGSMAAASRSRTTRRRTDSWANYQVDGHGAGSVNWLTWSAA